MKKITVLLVLGLLCFKGKPAEAASIKDLRNLAYGLQKEARNLYYDVSYNIRSDVSLAAEAKIRCKNFWEESLDYYAFIRSSAAVVNKEEQKSRVDILNVLSTKVEETLSAASYKSPAWEMCEQDLDKLNRIVFSVAESSRTNPYSTYQSYSYREGGAQKQNAAEQETSREVSLGVQTTGSDARLLWEVNQNITHMKIVCLEGRAILDVMDIEHDGRHPLARHLGKGESVDKSFGAGKYINKIMIYPRRVENVFKAECIITKK